MPEIVAPGPDPSCMQRPRSLRFHRPQADAPGLWIARSHRLKLAGLELVLGPLQPAREDDLDSLGIFEGTWIALVQISICDLKPIADVGRLSGPDPDGDRVRLAGIEPHVAKGNSAGIERGNGLSRSFTLVSGEERILFVVGGGAMQPRVDMAERGIAGHDQGDRLY